MDYILYCISNLILNEVCFTKIQIKFQDDQDFPNHFFIIIQKDIIKLVLIDVKDQICELSAQSHSNNFRCAARIPY